MLRQQGKRFAAAHVDADRAVNMIRFAQVLHDFRQEFRGQIVDAVVAEVLERVECDALAGSRHAGDQYQLHRLFPAAAGSPQVLILALDELLVLSMPRSCST